MANWKDVFNNEICKCGEKGTHAISKNNKIVKFACSKHYKEEQESIKQK